MRIFKTKEFARFARKEGISDAALIDAIARAERGLIDADLGGGLIRQRIARAGQGRSVVTAPSLSGAPVNAVFSSMACQESQGRPHAKGA